VRLEAANPAYPPIVVPAGAPSFRIAGKVVGVYRKL
jgi:SOS-response transcriptional repressor LexA